MSCLRGGTGSRKGGPIFQNLTVRGDRSFWGTRPYVTGPIHIKRGPTRHPCLLKAYVAVFVSLIVKAVHLEAVSDLTAEAFVACLRWFVAHRSKPNSIWSDHGTNFVGAITY